MALAVPVRMKTKDAQNTENKVFLPVEDVNFHDLFDWSTRNIALATACKPPTRTGTVRQQGLQQQNSDTSKLVSVNFRKVALFRLGTTVYATDEKCPHAGGPIHMGDIEALPDMFLCVTCPWHKWRFSLDNGKVVTPQDRNLQLKVYPTRVDDDGTIRVGFDSLDQRFFSVDNLEW